MTDREPLVTPGRLCAMSRQCRLRRESGGCPCRWWCVVDLYAGREPRELDAAIDAAMKGVE